ncbi:lymphocyte antigen 75 [Biomphalaria pfeifferi]|uniref:Lymphocyte antigen 75 n=1 Tax=Biomphalaria pfeifferi TaxID=112525 RepID=A0AAD8C7T3_BIOPF|nr:lymphocyte antigen 75 [Biomphalaria pfeifferi]
MTVTVVRRYSQLIVILGLVCCHCKGLTGQSSSCGQGWMEYKDSCYLLAQSNVTWSQARSKCLQESSELASIHSLEENNFLSLMLPNNSKYWIGLERLITGEKDHWTDNSSIHFLGFSNWSLWKLFSGFCFYMEQKSGDWKTSDCQYISDSGYICKRLLYNEPDDTQSQYEVGCKEQSPRTCYIFYTESIPWEEAQRWCRQQNQSLVTITDRQTLLYVKAFLRVHSITLWTGLSFYNSSLQWDSGVVQDPYPWMSGDKEISGCVALKSFAWDTQSCNTSLPFLCETRQDIPINISTSRTSTASNIRSIVSRRIVPGLHPLLTNTSKQSLRQTDIKISPEATLLKSLEIREAGDGLRQICSTGWTPRNNSCYKVFLERKSWHGARYHCESQGANLPSIHSFLENNDVSKLMKHEGVGLIWIGLHDSSNETDFEWTDGSPFDYQRWSKDEPNSLTVSEDCVEFHESGYWNDNNCNTIRSFVCVKDMGSTSVRPYLTTTEAPRCAETGWLYYDGYCYYLSEDSKIWMEAQDVCRSKGAELISLHSEDENNFLLHQLSKQKSWISNFYWIGLYRIGQDNYTWSDDTEVDYVAWYDRKPPGNIRCVTTKSEHALWFPSSCYVSNPFICKKSNDSSVTLPSKMTRTTPATRFSTERFQGICPERFISREDIVKCFYVGGTGYEGKLTWNEAKDACSNMSGQTKVQLASIRNVRQQAFLDLMMDRVGQNAWIGLKGNKYGYSYTWLDNSSVIYKNWRITSGFIMFSPNLHRFSFNSPCVYIIGDEFESLGEWIPTTCQTKHSYICETQKVAIPTVETGVSISSLMPATVSTILTSSAVPYTSSGASKSSSSPAECPEEFQKFHTSCYLVVSQLETWDDARSSCLARGADLAKTEHVLQLSKMTLLLADYGVKKPAWIGIKPTDGSSFEWTDHTPVRRFFWSDETMSIDSGNDLNHFCVSLSDNKWIRSECGWKQPYICETLLEIEPTATVSLLSNQSLCKDGKSVQHGDYCYLMEKDQVSWPEANYICRQRGMQLVSIRSGSETEFLVNQAQQIFDTFYYWIGLASYENGSFHWTDGSAMTYINWAEDYPEISDRQNKKCAMLDSNNGEWYPADCLTELPGYICSSVSENVNLSPRSDNSSSNISGGGVAAIVIVILSAFILVVLATIYAVRRGKGRPASDEQLLHPNGFENALYVSSDHNDEYINVT